MDRPYHTIHKNDTQALARFLTKQGQALLPMVELIDVLGRASVEAVLRLSGRRDRPPTASGEERRSGGLARERERYGRSGGAEAADAKEAERQGRRVPIPAYEAMHREGKLGSRMLEILLRGVSTR